MSDLAGVPLGPDVAGHPLALWLGAAAAGVGLAVYVNHRRASGGAAAADVASDGTVGGVPALPGSRGAVALGAPGASTAAPIPGDNNAWLVQAEQYLVSHGIDPLTADSALRKYLAGYALTTTEANAIRVALGTAVGPPPEGVPPLTVIPDASVSPILTPDDAPPPPDNWVPTPFYGYVPLPTTAGGMVNIPNTTGTITVEGTDYDLDNPTTIPALNPIVVENTKPGAIMPPLAGPVTVPAGPPQAPSSWQQQYDAWQAAGAPGRFTYTP